MRKPPKPRPDRLIVASLHGIVARRVREAGHRPLEGIDRDAAIAEIRHTTTQPDLLAQVAGIILGFDGDRVGHDLLVDAGADVDVIPAWRAEGERRAAAPRHSAP